MPRENAPESECSLYRFNQNFSFANAELEHFRGFQSPGMREHMLLPRASANELVCFHGRQKWQQARGSSRSPWPSAPPENPHQTRLRQNGLDCFSIGGEVRVPGFCTRRSGFASAKMRWRYFQPWLGQSAPALCARFLHPKTRADTTPSCPTRCTRHDVLSKNETPLAKVGRTNFQKGTS